MELLPCEGGVSRRPIVADALRSVESRLKTNCLQSEANLRRHGCPLPPLACAGLPATVKHTRHHQRPCAQRPSCDRRCGRSKLSDVSCAGAGVAQRVVVIAQERAHMETMAHLLHTAGNRPCRGHRPGLQVLLRQHFSHGKQDLAVADQLGSGNQLYSWQMTCAQGSPMMYACNSMNHGSRVGDAGVAAPLAVNHLAIRRGVQPSARC